MKKTDANDNRQNDVTPGNAAATETEDTAVQQPSEDFPTGNAVLDKWGPKFRKRSCEFIASTVLATPLNIGFVVFLFFSKTSLLWSVVSGAAVTVTTVLFMMAVCEIMRNVYMNKQAALRAQRERILDEEKRNAELRAAALQQRNEQTISAPAPVFAPEVAMLPKMETPALADALLPALRDAGVNVGQKDLLLLLSAMQSSRLIRMSGVSFRELSAFCTALTGAFGGDVSPAPIRIVPVDGNDPAARETLCGYKDSFRAPFVDEADRKKEFLPDLRYDNWTDDCVFCFVCTDSPLQTLVMDDWSVTLSIALTVSSAAHSAVHTASPASLQSLSGHLPVLSEPEWVRNAFDDLDVYFAENLNAVISNPLRRVEERMTAALADAGIADADAPDVILSCVRVPALLRSGDKAPAPEALTSLGEKINELFKYDNVPGTRALLSQATRGDRYENLMGKE